MSTVEEEKTFTVGERVAKGAEWLDTKNPEWFKRPEVDTLTSVRSRYCMADLALGEYGWDMALKELPGATSDYGFNAYSEENGKVVQEWKRVVAVKRAACSTISAACSTIS